ncbi:MAG: Do family serine endopeptidase [Bacteroidota bacterium]|jgi:Do/DeqQ family serine protease
MKKYTLIFVVACLGGLAAIGLGKLFGSKQSSNEFAQNYLAKYASLTDGGQRPDFVAIAELVTPTVVHILTVVDQPQSRNEMQEINPFDFFGGRGFNMPQPGPRAGSGSGVIISQDGLIVTNNHVIDGATKIKVVLNDKREYDAELLGKDVNTDLALLRISETNLPFAVIGNSDDVKVGQWVLAVGNPFNLTSTVTAGIISAKGRNLNINRGNGQQYPIESFIQTDAAVNPGNSGGALVSENGKLIGINTAIASETGQYAGYAFAIPSNLMNKVITDLQKFGTVQRGVLGVEITDVDGEMADKLGLKEVKGVYVRNVKENSAAEDAGIKTDDVIISADGSETKSTPELQELIGKKNPGDIVKIKVIREGKEKLFDVKLKGLDGKTTLKIAEKTEVNKALDSEFETLTRSERLKLKIANGIKVKSLGAKSVLKLAGVPSGFIITNIDKKPVSTVSDLKAAFEGKKGAVLVEGVKEDGTPDYYAVKIGK